MIFSNKFQKISSGKNISLYALDKNTFDLFVFLNSTNQKQLIFSNTLKCNPTNKTYNYNSVIRINDTFSCVCFDDNMSVVVYE